MEQGWGPPLDSGWGPASGRGCSHGCAPTGAQSRPGRPPPAPPQGTFFPECHLEAPASAHRAEGSAPSSASRAGQLHTEQSAREAMLRLGGAAALDPAEPEAGRQPTWGRRLQGPWGPHDCSMWLCSAESWGGVKGEAVTPGWAWVGPREETGAGGDAQCLRSLWHQWCPAGNFGHPCPQVPGQPHRGRQCWNRIGCGAQTDTGHEGPCSPRGAPAPGICSSPAGGSLRLPFFSAGLHPWPSLDSSGEFPPASRGHKPSS